MIEVGKTYKTREGRSARILATDRTGDFPIVGLINNLEIITWTSEGLSGLFSGEHRLDLMFERKSGWINWYSKDYCYESRNHADDNCAPNRTHVLEVIVEDGKPVDVKIHEAKK